MKARILYIRPIGLETQYPQTSARMDQLVSLRQFADRELTGLDASEPGNTTRAAAQRAEINLLDGTIEEIAREFGYKSQPPNHK